MNGYFLNSTRGQEWSQREVSGQEEQIHHRGEIVKSSSENYSLRSQYCKFDICLLRGRFYTYEWEEPENFELVPHFTTNFGGAKNGSKSHWLY